MWEQTKGKNMATKYISCTDTAKEIRKTLRENFPDAKFSVRSDQYSMGASIRVTIVSGKADKTEVEAQVKFFSGATFDGSTDSKNYHTRDWNGETVYWGADYVFVTDDRYNTWGY
jgi:hypothetical protein